METKEVLFILEDKKEVNELSKEILNIVLKYNHKKTQVLEVECNETKKVIRCHLEKIQAFIKKNEAIKFILPAFPAKSPNRNKTLSKNPDFGEYLGLKRLDNICSEIEKIYEPGGKFIICSDGRVFSDIVEVNDSDVTNYCTELKNMIKADNLNSISVFNLEDVFSKLTYEQMREELSNNYGKKISDIKQNVKQNNDEKALFNGLHKFTYEDMSFLHKKLSNSQIKKRSKEVTYHIIQRSHAWSGLVAQYFPECVRISIHPQELHTGKIGVQLVNCEHSWGTPWHNVVLLNENGYNLVKNKEAEKIGAKLIQSKNGYSYYSTI